jgi:hypothetical protein
VYINASYLICMFHRFILKSAQPVEHAMGKVKHGLVLPRPRNSRHLGVHLLVQMHVPDQTARRSQNLHCSLDLDRECADTYWMHLRFIVGGGAANAKVFIPFGGPQAHSYTQDWLPHKLLAGALHSQ